MARRIVVWGPPGEGEGVAAAIAAAVGDCDAVHVGALGEVVVRALTDSVAAVLLLTGPIGAHEERLDTIRTLRREGFPGPVLVAAAFLTEKDDALAAGADYAFDPDKKAIAAVVAAALEAPTVCADHPFLQALLVGEWVSVRPLGTEPPSGPVDVLLVATSYHNGAAFWLALADYRACHPEAAVIVVEDEIDEDVLAEALATGATHWVELAESGVPALLAVARASLRERWLRRLAAA